MDDKTERYYRALNLDPGASADQVTQAYEDLIRVWDPQRFANSPRLEALAEDKLNEIIEAYRALKQRPGVAPAPPPPPVPPIADHNVSPVLEEPAPLAQPVWVLEPPPAPPAVELPPEEPGLFVGNLEEQPKPARKGPRLLRIAASAAGFGLLLGGGWFLYERTTAPPRPGPTPPKPAAVATAEPSADEAEAVDPRKPARSPGRTPEPAPKQLATGSDLVAPRGRAGAGKFRIANESGQDAVVKVAAREAPAIPLRLVYVRPATEITLAGIGPGVYLVSFSFGPLTDQPRTFGAPVGPFQFVQIQSTGGYQSDEYKLTIQR